MIEFEFIKSKDSEILGNYLTHAHEIIIGSHIKSDIIIKDKTIAKFHLKITVNQHGLTVENMEKDLFFFSNSKKISGKKKHTINDEIGLSDTFFKIKKYEFTKYDDFGKELQQMYNQRCIELPQTEEFFTFFKNELMFIQNEINKLKEIDE